MSGIKLLSLLLLLLPAFGHLGFAQDAANPAKWIRSGFIVTWQTEKEDEPIIDIKRAIGLREQNCASQTGIRFGDNALMRETATLTNWPETVNRLSAAAELTDSREHAFELLDSALEDQTLNSEQRFFLHNQKMSLALRYREIEIFQGLLEEKKSEIGIAKALVADRIFLEVYALTLNATTRADWKAIDALLEQAVLHDGKYYNVIAWRVLAWLKIHSGGSRSNLIGADCSSMVKEFSGRLMSASEASPCPMMLGHFSHFLDKQFEARSDGSLQDAGKSFGADSTWRTFGDGVLGFISGNDAVAIHSHKSLKRIASSSSGKRSCSRELAVALKQLLESQQ